VVREIYWFIFLVRLFLFQLWEGGRAAEVPDSPAAFLAGSAYPIGPNARESKIELGLEGFFTAPSRPIPKTFGRTRRSSLPFAGVISALQLAPFALARASESVQAGIKLTRC